MPRIPERRRGRSDDALREIRHELERAWFEERGQTDGILLVDCAKEEREAFVSFMRRAGLEPIVHCDAASAFATATAVRPRIVIVDRVLGETSGWDLVHRIRRDDPTRDFVAVLLTTPDSAADARTAERAGADLVLMKPCSPERLVTAIMECLRQRSGAGESRTDRAPGIDSTASL